MDRLQINGGKPLEGEVTISGAKNAALPELCAALLAAEPLTLANCPRLNDVKTMETLLSQMGVTLSRSDDGHSVTLDAADIAWPLAPYELVKTMRASILTLGPLLARCGKARVSMPGGCAIGLRPVDQHIKGLQAMGAEIDLKHGYIGAEGRLKGTEFSFDMPTVTGTENLMMAATLADGLTRLHNAAREPEIVDLAKCLNAMGAKVKGAGSETIEIEGVKSLHGAHHRVMPDRIESGTFLAAAAATRGHIVLHNSDAAALKPVLDLFADIGLKTVVSREADDDRIELIGNGKLKSFSITTAPHPGFPTDMQAQMMALAIAAEGVTTISETIFEHRMMHVQELNRLGAEIEVDGNTAKVKGGTPLSGATVMATDLRASASLVIAALMAEGVTTIERIYHLDRGYEAMEAKLMGLGAKVIRVTGDR